MMQAVANRAAGLPVESNNKNCETGEEIHKKFNLIPSVDLEAKIQELCIFKQSNILRVWPQQMLQALFRL